MKYINFSDFYLLIEEIGNPEYLVTRLEVTEDRQIDLLPFQKHWRESFRKKLSKSKYGVAICELGFCTEIEHPDQIKAREVVFLDDMFYLLTPQLREALRVK